MSNNEQNLSEEELKRKAYTEGLKLLKAGMDSEVIYARLEKQGIPDVIIAHVIKNLFIQRKKDKVKAIEPFYNVALVRIAIGVVAAVISYMLMPNQFIIPIGLIAGGILSALLLKKKMEE